MPPSIKSAMIAASLCLITNRLTPLNPSVYSTLMATYGWTKSSSKLSRWIRDSLGVVISTFCPSKAERAVAELPNEILPTSPNASCSISVK